MFLIDNQEVRQAGDMGEYIANHPGLAVTLTVERAGQRFTTTLTPRTSPPPGEGPIGLTLYPVTSLTRMALESLSAASGYRAVYDLHAVCSIYAPARRHLAGGCTPGGTQGNLRSDQRRHQRHSNLRDVVSDLAVDGHSQRSAGDH